MSICVCSPVLSRFIFLKKMYRVADLHMPVHVPSQEVLKSATYNFKYYASTIMQVPIDECGSEVFVSIKRIENNWVVYNVVGRSYVLHGNAVCFVA